MRSIHTYIVAGCLLIAAGCAGAEDDAPDAMVIDTLDAGAPNGSAGMDPANSAESGGAITPGQGTGTADVSSDVVTAEGWGPVRIGMTRQEVVAAAGPDANPNAVGGAEPEVCDMFRPDQAPEGMLMMFENNVLSRITVSDPADVGTPAGVHVGDSAAAAKSAYGNRATSMPHKYVAAPAEYINVFDPASDEVQGFVFEVDGDGNIIHIHAGGPSIQYVEGCS